jgi:hypothetical protein
MMETTVVDPHEIERTGSDAVATLRAEVERVRIVLQDVADRLIEIERGLAKLKAPADATQTLPVAELNASNDE